MPEGDNVLQVARVLGRELPGRTLDFVEIQDLGPVAELAGRRVQAVEPRLRVKTENQDSTRFIQDAPVGVKCR